jgi:GNAT superfamily N-acetyltransferase
MTTTDAPALTVSRIPVPDDLDGPDARAFLEMVRIGNVMCRHDAGHDALDRDAREVLGEWQDAADWIHLGFSAERDGTIIGVVDMFYPVEEGTTTSEINVMVDPDHWGEGAEEALLEAVLDEARARGRKSVQTWTLHRPDATGPMLTPPTGFGAIPAEDRQTVFMIESGFSFEQVERNSAFDLQGSFGEVERRLADALAVAGGDYRLVEWTSPTPEEHLETFAYVISRMQTDTPQGGLVTEEHHWDADRVRRRDARLRSQGLLVSIAAVQHVPTGAIVAYNELTIGADRGAATQQYGTLVLKEHRGHRLGTIVKCANLVRWHRLAPESPRVSTFNAEENRPMLDINEAIGFVPVSYAGAWQKELS